MRRVLAASQIYSFGPFELKSSPMTLLRDGLPVVARPQTLQMLEILVTHAGNVVSRQDIRERLWGDGRTVEFERSINTTMRDLRRALGDTYEEPRFIETVPRQGYRFVAPVQVVEKPLALQRRMAWPRLRKLHLAIGGGAAALGLAAVLGVVGTSAEPSVTLAVTAAPSESPELSTRSEELAADLYHVLSVHYSQEIDLVATEPGIDLADGRGDYLLESNLSSARDEELTIAVRLIDRSHETIVWSEVYRVAPSSAGRWPDLAGRDVVLALREEPDL